MNPGEGRESGVDGLMLSLLFSEPFARARAKKFLAEL